MDEFEKQVEHLSALAMTPGWWAYAQARAMELDAQTAFTGLRAEVRQLLTAAKFRPAAHELRG